MATAMKSMVTFITDVSSSMRQPIKNVDGPSKIDVAKNYMTHCMTQQILRSKTMEFCAMLVGDSVTHNYMSNQNIDGYEGVNEILEMAPPAASSLQAINQITARGPDTADIYGGIVLAVDIYARFNATKSYNRIVVVITDGESFMDEESYNSYTEKIIQELQVRGVTVYFAYIQKTVETSSVVKVQNKEFYSSLACATGGILLDVESIDDCLYLLGERPGIGTRPVLMAMSLKISDSISIDCKVWSKVSKATFPSLKKRTLSDNNSSSKALDETYKALDATSEIVNDVSYRDPDKPDEEISKDDIVSSFRYGQLYYPVSEVDECATRIEGEKGIKILGFLESSKVPRYHFLDETNVIQGDSDEFPVRDENSLTNPQKTQLCIATIAKAMHSLNQCAIARYVKKDNADPIMVALTLPDRQNGTLLMHRLPFVDDVKFTVRPSLLQKPSVLKVTQEQKEAVSHMVDRMTVKTPAKRRLIALFQAYHNTIKELRVKLNAASPNIHFADPFRAVSCFNSSTTPPSTLEDIDSRIQQTLMLFPTTKVEISSEKDKSFWANGKHTSTGDGASVEGNASKVRRLNEVDDVNECKDDGSHGDIKVKHSFTLGVSDPVDQFNNVLTKMCSSAYSQVELDDILRVMKDIIIKDVTIGRSVQHFNKAVDCLEVFKKQALSLGISALFNEFMVQLKQIILSNMHAYAAFWEMLQVKHLSLINVSDDATVDTITDSDSTEFLIIAATPDIGATTTVFNTQQNFDDDLLDMIE